MFVPLGKLFCCVFVCGHQIVRNRPRTSVSQRRSQLEESLAILADVIGGNVSVCDWDKWYHKVTLSPCVCVASV